MSRFLVVGFMFGLVCAGLLAEEPKAEDLAKKPQWQRLLTGEDAKIAKKLEKRIQELEAADNYAEALKATEELLQLRTKLQGAEHHESKTVEQFVVVLKKVAPLKAKERQMWRQVRARWSEALQLRNTAKYAAVLTIQREILDIHLKVLGEEHRDTATSYNNVASTLDGQGKSAEAGPLYQKALDINLKVLGEEHPYTANSYNNLAYNLAAQGKTSEVGPLLQKALNIYRKVLGEEHQDTANSYNNVAANLQAQGKASEAGLLYQKALDIYRKVLGEEHRSTAAIYNNLASNLQAQGKAAEAELLDRKALDIYIKVLGEEHPDTAESYNHLALNLCAQGKAAEAGPLLQKALNIHRKVLGEEHPDTATSYNNVAANLQAQGKASEAGPLYQKALNIRRKVLGEEHPATAKSYNNVAANLDAQEKAAEAEPLHRKSLEILRKVLGEEHSDIANSYNGVAANLTAQGKAAEAGPLFQKALDIYRKVWGEEHPATAKSYNNLALNLYAQGKAAEAGPLYQKALDIYRKLLGAEHPATATSYSNVAFIRLELGDIGAAKTTLTDGIRAYESSSLAGATGLERGNLAQFNPRLLLASLMAEQEPRAAWGHLELSLARGLFDQQSNATRLTSAEQQSQQETRQRLASLQPRILNLVTRSHRTEPDSQVLQALLNQRREEEAAISRLAVLDSERAMEPGDRIQSALPADAALLYWVDFADSSGRVQEHWSCVVRKTGEPKWQRLPGTGENGKWSKADTELPGQLRLALSTSASAGEIEVLTKKLHAQRIAPVLPYLVGVKTLHVVPVGVMAGIPIEILVPSITVDYVPSGSYLARLWQQPRIMGQQMLAVGDPVYPEKSQATAVATAPLPPGGLLITQLVPTGVAASVGMKAGDVLLSYAGQKLASVDDLKTSITADEKTEKNTLTVWRDGKTITREVPPGKLGVVLDLEPAPKAIASRRKTNETLAKLTRGGDWDELPGTAAELKGLESLFPRSTILTRKDASTKKLTELLADGKLKEYAYLHFATHGEGNATLSMQSSLILHGDDQSIARLIAQDILEKWKLNANLVTLSACETAIGRSSSSEGLLGFAQAFLTAGARSVCLSLWKVDDGATTLLMDRFYRNLLGKRKDLDKPMPKALALDEAKRWLRNLSTEEATDRLATLSKDVSRGAGAKAIELTPPKPATDAKPEAAKKPFDHPKYWAAFILIGDPN
jgi:tetratricopeptide (TPR) repeat protein